MMKSLRYATLKLFEVLINVLVYTLKQSEKL